MPSPIGLIGLAAAECGVCRVALSCAEGRFAGELAELSNDLHHGGEPLRAVKAQLERYFAGCARELAGPLDFPAGTAFQQTVWRAMRAIPYGETRSYGWLAGQAGSPRAARAVGRAAGANPVPIFCPCHRVVRSDGSAGGFSAGIGIKQFLLRLEGGREAGNEK